MTLSPQIQTKDQQKLTYEESTADTSQAREETIQKFKEDEKKPQTLTIETIDKQPLNL